MKKSILLLVSVFLVMLCSKSTEQANVGQFSNQLTQFPEGITPSNPVQELPGTDAIPAQGVIARKSAWLRHHTQVNTNVYVLGNCTGHGCLDPAEAPANPKAINNANSELTVGVSVTVPAGRVLKADKIRLKNRANVQGTTEANTYAKHNSATIANQVNTLGALPHLPFFLSGTPGTQNVNDATSTLAPGQYRNLTVRKDKLITLAGGFYQFHDIDLKKKSTLLCQTQCFLTVKADVIAEKEITIAATSANPNDFVIYVEGGNAAAEPMAAASKAVQLGGMSHVTANIYAVNGRLQFGAATIAQGALIGNHVRIEPNSIVTAGPAPVGTVKLFEAGVPGSIEIPGKVKLDVPACALAEDTVISVQPKPDAGANRRTLESWNFYQISASEFSPAGLEFDCGVSLSANYANLNLPQSTHPASLVMATSEDNVHYQYLPSVPNLPDSKTTASIRHFSVYLLASPPTSTNYHRMAAKYGSILYAIGYPNRLTIYDVSNPATATNVAELSLSHTCTYSEPTGVIREGNRLYVTLYCWNGYYQSVLITYDISNPQLPQELGRAVAHYQYWYLDYTHINAGSLYLHVYNQNDGLSYLSKVGLSSPATLTQQLADPNYYSWRLWGNGDYIYRDLYNANPAIYSGSTFTNTGAVVPKLLSNDYIYAMTFTGNAIVYVEQFQSAPYPLFIVKHDLTSGTAFSNQRLTALSFFNPDSQKTLHYIHSLTAQGSRILALGNAYDSTQGYTYAASWQDTPTIPVVEDSEYFSSGDYFSPAYNPIFEFPYAYVPTWNNPNPLRILAFQPTGTPPVVISATPPDGATAVSTATSISVTFGQAMNPATLTASTTTACMGSVQVSYTEFATCMPMSSAIGVMSNGNQTVTFSPVSLYGGTRYKIRVTTAAQSSVGLNLQTQFQQTTGWLTTAPAMYYSYIGSSMSDGASTLTPTHDNGVLISGQLGTPLASFAGLSPNIPYTGSHLGGDGFLLKLNAGGIAEWFTYLPFNQGAVARTVDNGFIIAGIAYSNIGSINGINPLSPYTAGQNIILLKLSASGVLSWFTYYGSTSPIELGPASVIQTSDGGFAITGFSAAPINSLAGVLPINPHAGIFGFRKSDTWVIKVRSDASVQWHTFIGGQGDDMGAKIAEFPNGDLAVLGSSSMAITDIAGLAPLIPFANSNPTLYYNDAMVARLGSNGVLQWYTFLGDTNDNRLAALAVTNDGGLVLTGSEASYNLLGGVPALHLPPAPGSYDIHVIKLTGSGGVLWHAFHGSDNSDFAGNVQETAAGNILIGGTSRASGGNNWWGYPQPLHILSGGNDLMLLQLDAGGNYLWHNFWGSTLNETMAGMTILQDGSVMLLGTADSNRASTEHISAPIYPYVGSNDMLILKGQANGAFTP